MGRKHSFEIRTTGGGNPGCPQIAIATGRSVVAQAPDRLGRSVKEVLTIADDLHARGVGVKILTGKLSGSYSPTW